MLYKWFQKYLESRPCLTAFNDSQQKEPRQHVHFILFPSNRWFNITLNQILDRPEWYRETLHNHPWPNISIILKGGYWEKTEKGLKWHGPGSIIFRSAKQFHCIWIEEGREAWTLFIHGPMTKSFDFIKDGEPITLEQLGMKKAVFTR